MKNVKVSELVELCRDELERGNDTELSMKIGRDAEGTPYKVEISAAGNPLFDMPIEIEGVLPDSTPASAPDLDVETVKSNVLGWLNLAMKEAARLNVKGREAMCDAAMTSIQNTMEDIRRYVC